MRINILYNFRKEPWGGGNQFLKALKKEFEKRNIYEGNPEKAEAILFNGYPFGAEYLFNRLFRLKQKNPSKIAIYRLDGPVSFVRGRDEAVDKIISTFNDLLVDGIIFQSNWSREQNKKYFGISSRHETVIYNAPDNEIFSKVDKKDISFRNKIKLIAVSWSSNWRKGFDIYKYLDENLDFSKYQMTFVGNSPIDFKSIKWLKSVVSEKLAKMLRENDIYITASRNDPCSNALIEALSCGLPAVALDSGGHSELLQEGGELFTREEDVIEKIEKVTKNYKHFQSRVPKFLIKEIAEKYYNFAKKIFSDAQSKRYQPKQVNLLTKLNFVKMQLLILKWKGLSKLRTMHDQ